MNIHEYQAKELLKQFGVNVSNGVVILSTDEIDQKIKQIRSKKHVLKAQIHAGGRGKAGGVKLCNSLEELKNKIIISDYLFLSSLVKSNIASPLKFYDQYLCLI